MAPEGCKEPRCLLCKDRFRGPRECGRSGQPGSLLQVAGLDEHTENLLQVVLAKGGPANRITCSFIHSFVLRTVLKSLLGLGHDAQH